MATSAINFETNKVTLISAVTGIPGGWAMAGTIPADIAQYMGHLLWILQKLIYLYGLDELIDEDGCDDETTDLIILFMGIMFGVEVANATISKVAMLAAQRASKKLQRKHLLKLFIIQ